MAIYQVTEAEIPLCLSCYAVFSQLQQAEIENNERWMNYYSEEIAASVGMPHIGPKFPPRPRPVQVGSVNLNNIKVSGSVVGSINTGTIGSIDQTITAIRSSGEPNLAQAVTELSQAFLSSKALSEQQKNELMEIMSVVAGEVATPKESRRTTVAKSLLARAQEIASVANDITDICQKWWPVLSAGLAAVAGT